jgi:hypothetical protein
MKTKILILTMILISSLQATTYYWNGSKVYNVSSWWTGSGVTGSNPSNFTTSGDIWDLNLSSSASVDISGWEMKGTLINSGSGTATLTTASGSFTSTNTIGAWVSPNSTLVVSSINVTYSQPSSKATVVDITYNNLTLTHGTSNIIVLGTIEVNGTLTTTSGGTLVMGGNQLKLGSGSTLVNNGTISTGALSDWVNDSRSVSSGTFTGKILFSSQSGLQAIPAATYTDLSFNNAGGTSNKAAGAITVNGILYTRPFGILDMDIYTLTLGSGSTVDNVGQISTKRSSGWVSDGRSTSAFNGTITFAAASGGQTIPVATYANLRLINTSGANTAAGSITVSGNLIILNTGGIFDIGANTLTVSKFVGPGHIKGSSSSNITYTGGTQSFLYMDSTTDGITNRLNRLTLTKSAKMNLGNTLYIFGNTSNTLGDLILGSDLVTYSTLTSNVTGSQAALLKLKLSSSNTPAIIALNGGSIAGEIYYEDYLNAGYRGYRQWGHCLDSASGMSLNQITDNINSYADVTSGSGGRGSSGNINGLLTSTSTAKNSVFTYDESLYSTSSRWVPYKIDGATVLYATKGKGLHFVLRPTGTGESGSYDAQVIDYEGQPNTTADVTVSVTRSTTLGSNDGWNLLSNPYPSYLNWASFVSDNSANLKNTTGQALYKYDKATKNYKATTLSGAKWYSSSSADLGTTPSIDPGDAFFTQIASGVSTLTFKRSQTTATRQSSIDRTNKLEIDSTIYSTLYIKMRSASDSTIGDEATVISGSWGGDMKYGAGDALNLGGTCLDLSILSGDDQKLAFKTVSNKSSWLIPLYMTSCTQGDYTFDFSINANKSGAEGQYELVDNFKKTKKPLKDGDRVFYQITGDSNSFGSGRFYINSIMNTTAVDGMATTEQSWLVYPNPTTADGEISIANPKGLATSVTIVNALGGVVHAQEIKANELGVKINLSPLHLSTGIYYIQMLNSIQQTTERLIIRNN